MLWLLPRHRPLVVVVVVPARVLRRQEDLPVEAVQYDNVYPREAFGAIVLDDVVFEARVLQEHVLEYGLGTGRQHIVCATCIDMNTDQPIRARILARLRDDTVAHATLMQECQTNARKVIGIATE